MRRVFCAPASLHAPPRTGASHDAIGALFAALRDSGRVAPGSLGGWLAAEGSAVEQRNFAEFTALLARWEDEHGLAQQRRGGGWAGDASGPRAGGERAVPTPDGGPLREAMLASGHPAAAALSARNSAWARGTGRMWEAGDTRDPRDGPLGPDLAAGAPAGGPSGDQLVLALGSRLRVGVRFYVQ